METLQLSDLVLKALDSNNEYTLDDYASFDSGLKAAREINKVLKEGKKMILVMNHKPYSSSFLNGLLNKLLIRYGKPFLKEHLSIKTTKTVAELIKSHISRIEEFPSNNTSFNADDL